MFDLTGKTAWVTGSTRNLGRIMIEDFAKQGADVVVSNVSNDEERKKAVAEISSEYDSEVMGVQVDIRDPDSVENAVEEIADSLGSVDILVNNAAIRPHQSIDEITLDDWENVLRTNLTGAWLCSKAVLPGMKDNGWGRIIHIGGTNAFIGSANRLHNVVAKAGLVGLTRALPNEVSEYGITVNCVVPGTFDTERPDGDYPTLDTQYNLLENSRVLLRRLGKPEELSPAVIFLASKEASYMTGQTVFVNGGRYPAMRAAKTVDLDEICNNRTDQRQ